jgi:1-pyrroline-5-carboxylate dehydrogenase
VTGPGKEVGDELIANQEIDGIAFTGSQEVGMEVLRRSNQERPRPCIAEMGGKNPCIVMPTANLDDAVEGVARAAFSMGGQKCSACSRVYVHQGISKKFVEALVEKTKSLKLGDPVDCNTFLGPLINKEAVKKYEHAVKLGKKDGHLAYGGNVLDDGDFEGGYYVQPTVLRGVEKDSKWFDQEFFTPVVALVEVKSLQEAVKLANKSKFGLTAGIFTQIEDEQREFFSCIEAGTSYCNRRGGATTGAWPGVQSFGGWKSSGSTGKNALGPHYVPQFMREQSQTLVVRAPAPAPAINAPRRADLLPVGV